MPRLKQNQLIPLIVFIGIMIYAFYPELKFAVDSLMATSRGPATDRASCESQDYDREAVSGPKITNIYPQNLSWDVPLDSNLLFEVKDTGGGVNLDSLEIDIEFPGHSQYLYTIDDTKYLTVVDVGDGTYLLSAKPEDDIPYAWTGIVRVNAADCNDNWGTKGIFFVATPTLTDLFLSLGAYPLQYLIWFIAIFGPVVRGYRWSTVYDSDSKEPVPKAIVRVFQNGSLVDTTLTDANGVFKLAVDDGEYRLQVQAPGYKFPSSLAPLTADGNKQNLYYGQEVKKEGGMLRINIPLDPAGDDRKVGASEKLSAAFSSTLAGLNTPILLLGIIGPIAIWPSNFESWVYSGVNLALLLGQLIVKRQLGKDRYGRVFDEFGRPLPGVSLGLYSVKDNTLIKKELTDEKGRYQFIVPGGEYYLRPTGNRYTMKQVAVDKGLQVGQQDTDNIVIALDVTVERIKGG